MYTYATLALNLGESFVLVYARRPLELHVSDVVTCFDDDPSMQVYLESVHISHVSLDSTLGRNAHISLCSGSS